MNKKFHPSTKWLRTILPDGFLLESSILISGPGGSGKPIIAYDIAREWLQNGDSVILFLTSTTYDYTKTVFQVLGIDLDEYNTKKQVFIVEFDPSLSEPRVLSETRMKINFLRKEHWDQALAQGKQTLFKSTNGILFVASALNLLYFSPTYRESMHAYLLEKLKTPENGITLLWTVNSQAYKSYIDYLEKEADILMVSVMEKESMSLYVHVVHAKNQKYNPANIKIPVTKDVIRMLKQEAESGRTHLLPILKKI